MKWNNISEKQPNITRTTMSEPCLCKNILTDAERKNFPIYEICADAYIKLTDWLLTNKGGYR